MYFEKRSGEDPRKSECRISELKPKPGYAFLQRNRRNLRQRRNRRNQQPMMERRTGKDRRIFPFLIELVGRNEAMRLVSKNN